MKRFCMHTAWCVLSVASLTYVGCGKKDKKKEPTKSSDAVGGGIPDGAVGQWVQGSEGLYLVERTHGADGKGAVKINLQGEKALDVETVLSFDEATSPKRFFETITKINKKSDAVDDINVGDVTKCIYEMQSETSVKLECGDDYPGSFTDEAEVYTKK